MNGALDCPCAGTTTRLGERPPWNVEELRFESGIVLLSSSLNTGESDLTT